MSIERAGVLRGWWWLLAVLAACCSAASWCSPVHAQGVGFQQAVGGVSVDGFGVVTNVEIDTLKELGRRRSQEMQPVQGDLDQPSEMRMVSLSQMQAAIAEARGAGREIPDEVRYLAGIQRIQYVFVYPEKNDIVLAGFGEGWLADDLGNMVGKTTGRPVIELDDLLVALRTAESAARGGISCSIDPTPEGLKRIQAFMATPSPTKADPDSFARGMEKELGLQTVTIRGVPKTSHFAAVLLAADYRMKRIAMAFERSPVKGLTSYLQTLKGTDGGLVNVQQRWWLSNDYEPLLSDEEGLAWELRGQGVKAMTEDEFVAANGERTVTGKANPKAQKWAEKMTEKYDELSAKEPIFGELRNCMDLAVIGALIVKENLAAKAGCDLSLLLDPSRVPSRYQLQIPRQLPTLANYIETHRKFVFSASGGVLVNSWGAAEKKEQNAALSPARSKAGEGRADRWWWN
ncbi:MAG TPA: DUF1598 domain-containing protein [Pirellulales bacterium]|nr:DUF1598 domain-containing protein [Pirellulales bacterium]